MLLSVTAQFARRMIASPALSVFITSPARLATDPQFVRVITALPELSDSVKNPSKHRDAVQLLRAALALTLLMALRKTPTEHSVNRESCAITLPAVELLEVTAMPSLQARTSVPVTKRLPPFGMSTPFPLNSDSEQCST